jgi:hypothetical protein
MGNKYKNVPLYENDTFVRGAPTRIRTEVLALKGLRPSPLDDGGKPRDFTTATQEGSSNPDR